MHNKDGASDSRLWITPAADDESRGLLVWNGLREQFEMPVVAAGDVRRLAFAAARQEMWDWDANCPLSVSSLPLANLPQDVGTPDCYYYSAICPVATSPAGRDSWEWVSVKDILIGFTKGCWSIDPDVRKFLESTGRSLQSRSRSDSSLTIGVVGNGKLPEDDVPVLFNKVHQALEDLVYEFPDRQVQVISALGMGSEQLLADVALERGLRLEVALPMPLELYQHEFEHAAALQEFQETLARAACWYSLPLNAGIRDEPLQHTPRIVQSQRVALGRYIVDRSQVLLAIWDGRTAQYPGGMMETLKYALHTPRRPDQRLLIRHIPIYSDSY